MANVSVYNIEGKEVGSIELNDAVFGVEVNEHLVHMAVVNQLVFGRHTPFFNNYRPQFYFRTTDVTGVCDLPEGIEMCMPGDNVEMTVELIHPVAMEEGLRFAIREGGRTVGSGTVASIIE